MARRKRKTGSGSRKNRNGGSSSSARQTGCPSELQRQISPDHHVPVPDNEPAGKGALEKPEVDAHRDATAIAFSKTPESFRERHRDAYKGQCALSLGNSKRYVEGHVTHADVVSGNPPGGGKVESPPIAGAVGHVLDSDRAPRRLVHE